MYFLSVYLQSSKVDPGDESASCLRSSSLSRVTWRSWYKIVSSFSLICLVSVTGGGDDALPVVPDEEINNWQWANASKEQYNSTKEVSTNFKKPCISVCRILFKNEAIHVSFHQWVERVSPVRPQASKDPLLKIQFAWLCSLVTQELTSSLKGKFAVTIAKTSETTILTEVIG